MNLAQNKLLVSIGAVFGVGCLILLGMLYSAYSSFDDASTAYQEQETKLDKLQKLPLYPEEGNLKILLDQKQQASQAAIDLHKTLLPMAFPLEPLTPSQFQDRLNTAIKTLTERATAIGATLDVGSHLGFPEYRTAVPRPEAAAVLGRQLKCIELAVSTLIDQKVSAIEKITRTPLPEEQPPKATSAPAPGAKPAAAPAVPLLEKFPFEIQFAGTQDVLKGSLNELSKTTQQFFIIRPLLIKNQGSPTLKRKEHNMEKSLEVARMAAQAAAESAAVTGAASTALPPVKFNYVFGSEKLNVTLRFDAVIFTKELPKTGGVKAAPAK